MEYNYVLDTVCNIIVKKMGLNQKDVSANTKLFKDLGADSLDFVEIVMETEAELGVTIHDKEATDIQSVSDVVKLVCQKRGITIPEQQDIQNKQNKLKFILNSVSQRIRGA